MPFRGRENEPPMPDPLAFFLTWPTYGTWLPGDERGWVERGLGWMHPDPVRQLEADARMTEDACRLDPEQRQVVERTVAEVCTHRGWHLYVVNCRSNHMHVVVAANRNPKIVRNQLKAWCTRRLKELEATRLLTRSVSENSLRRASEGTAMDSNQKVTDGSSEAASVRENWWAERGSQRYLNDTHSLEAAILYVRDGQDHEPET